MDNKENILPVKEFKEDKPNPVGNTEGEIKDKYIEELLKKDIVFPNTIDSIEYNNSQRGILDITPLTGNDKTEIIRNTLRKIEEYNKNNKFRLRYAIQIHDILMPIAEDFSNNHVGLITVSPSNPISRYFDESNTNNYPTIAVPYENIDYVYCTGLPKALQDKVANRYNETTQFLKTSGNKFTEYEEILNNKLKLTYTSGLPYTYRDYVLTFLDIYEIIKTIDTSLDVSLTERKVKIIADFCDFMDKTIENIDKNVEFNKKWLKNGELEKYVEFRKKFNFTTQTIELSKEPIKK